MSKLDPFILLVKKILFYLKTTELAQKVRRKKQLIRNTKKYPLVNTNQKIIGQIVKQHKTRKRSHNETQRLQSIR